MSEIFSSTPFILLLVLGSYLAGCKLYRKKHIALFHPLLSRYGAYHSSPSLLDIDYDTFCAGSSFISFLFRTLGRCTGICPLRTNRANQRERDTRTYCCLCRRYRRYSKCHSYLQNHGSRRDYHLVTATQIGNHTHRYLLVGTLEWHTVAHRSYRIRRAFAAGSSVLPFSTAVMSTAVARGLALGWAAHGLGTARAIELGAVEGAISGLAIGLMGVITSLLIPLFESIMR